MKTIKISFLFFCLHVTGLFPIISNGQESADSLFYYYDLVINPQKSTDFSLAYRFYERYKKTKLLERDTLRAIEALRYMVVIQKELGFLYDSEVTTIEGLELLNNIKVNDRVIESKVGLYNHLGIIHRKYGNYEEALKYYEIALGIALKQADSISIFNNKAYVYMCQKAYKLAVKEFTEVYNEKLKTNDKKQIARALSNLGAARSYLDIPVALDNIKEALRIREEISDIAGLYSSYKHLTEYYKRGDDNLNAEYYANKAYGTAKLINSPEFIKDALSHIIDLDNNPKVIEYKKLSDSITLARRLSENKYASVKYESIENSRKAQESELQREKEKILKIRFQFIGVLGLGVFIGLYFVSKNRHNREKAQQVYQTETRISKKVHDEVANDLYQVMTKLQFEANSNLENVLDDLEGIYNKTRDISKENSIIDVDGDFNDLLNDLLLSYKTNDINVITQNITKMDWKAVSNIKKTTFYRVLQELMTNMRKHSKASIVLISFDQIKNKIIINYKDNGVGSDLSKNNGLLNAENRIKSIKGTITFESQINKSFKAKIIV